MLLEFLLAFLGVLSLAVPVHGQDQSGFVSIDCGSLSAQFLDPFTGLNYISDDSFIQGENPGIPKMIAIDEFKNTFVLPQHKYLRSFPGVEGDRNCYNVTLTKYVKYLIRATFLYGNYDNLNEPPSFDLHLGPNKWDTVQLWNSAALVYKEIIYIPTVTYIQVCLVQTGRSTPFISTLELRPLKNTTYVTQNGSLALIRRSNCGFLNYAIIRYPDDDYDRLWYPDHIWNSNLSTLQAIDSRDYNDFRPPSTVMMTADTSINASTDLNINTHQTTPQFYYVYMYFAEIDLKANQSRHFNISVNGEPWYGPVTPEYLRATIAYTNSPIGPFTGGNFTFSFFPVGDSTLPPILNAVEAYSVIYFLQSETDQEDIDAIKKIKSRYGISTRNWQGDPCAPQDYVWNGLSCSYNGTAPPIITSLNLSSNGLTGGIAPDIANLKSLMSLDLSNNSLSGTVPGFLSQLLSLKILNLSGNNLSGSIPVDLLKRNASGSLLLSVSGNPGLCLSDSCNNKKKKKKLVVSVAASVSSLFAIVILLAIIFRVHKRRKQQVARHGEDKTRRTPLLELKRRQFTYSEVVNITNNFERVLGRGGFGTVYYGCLDDLQVAVKMLSSSSVQGYNEFQAEVKLLLRVHHRNLTSLIGYCNENDKIGLIYEYMANGNLKDHLSDGNPNILSWKQRLQIALEAAQGLEYLHKGCKAPVVHRDVKTTNILLNDKFQAKISDFGLSRTFQSEAASHVSTVVAGTPGYLDPEYYATHRLTEKSDVFSFGVVLLEMITSQPVIAMTNDRTHISQWVNSLLKNGDIENIIDSRLGGDFKINSVWKAVELAMACASTTSATRPTMNQVVVELNECLTTEMAPTGGFNSSFEIIAVDDNLLSEVSGR
ncbi:LRR receptor-like serine/threonine-protein kinase IOS1 [Hevea brasiliensis]|uniref:LRR receptor-like serine/threonine-protein kinase IOS1 n=1 Tax=Hevea brasiliensis TaxID=3981 RepID=UPI0025DF0C0A|nr:LRR receptor-like serine/threonine-protein kinase IOS1 [Hevea brasiliensis]